MGFFGFFKRQLKTVIEWNNSDSTLLFQQADLSTDELKNASQLIIHPGQGALLIYQDEIIDSIDQPGTYPIKTDNHPFITNLLTISQNFESEHKISIIFFRTAELSNQGWGTSSSIKYFDSHYQFPIKLSAYGNFSVKLIDANTFYSDIVDFKAQYSQEELKTLITSRLLPKITVLLASEKHSYDNLDTQLVTLAKALTQQLGESLLSLGFQLTNFQIEAMNFNDATLEHINRIADSRTDQLAADEVNLNYLAHEKIKTIRDAAKNGGGLASTGLQMGMEVQLAKSAYSKTNQDPELKAQTHKLTVLKDLLDSGIISQTDYDTKKDEILNPL